MNYLKTISPRTRLLYHKDEDPLEQSLNRYERRLRQLDMASCQYMHFSRLFGRVSRELLAAQVYNLRYIIKWMMLARPRWRKRVLKDLGGEAALEKWETRQMRAYAQADRPREDNRQSKPSKTISAVCDKVKRTIVTDRFGHFRLAPIARAKRQFDPRSNSGPLRSHSQTPARKSKWAREDMSLTDLAKQKPIPLWPEELRGEVCDVDLGFEPDADPEFEFKLTKWGNPPKIQRLPYEPCVPIEKPNQAWSYAMAKLPADAVKTKEPP